MDCTYKLEDKLLKFDSSKRPRSHEGDDCESNPKKKMPLEISGTCSSDYSTKESDDTPIDHRNKSVVSVKKMKDSFDEEEIFSLDVLANVNDSAKKIQVKDKYINETDTELVKEDAITKLNSSSVEPLFSSCPVPINTTYQKEFPSQTASPYSNSKYDESNLSELDLEHLSSSICETESLTSLSQSMCSEDLSVSFKKSKKKKGKKKKAKVTDNRSKVKEDDIFLPPNYFVGIQVSNPEIHKGIVEIQNGLVSFDEKLGPALIDVATLHITLLVAHIATEDDLQVACSALDSCGAMVAESISNPPLTLKFSGISHFSNQTLFAKVVEDENYYRLISVAGLVRKVFSEKGVITPDKRDLKPHLTIAKLSKVPRGKGKSGIRKIDPRSYNTQTNKIFGEQTVSSFQLLSMNKPKDQHRYYFNSRETFFDLVSNESSDHSQCCQLRRPVLPTLARNFHTSSPVESPSLPSVFFPFRRPSKSLPSPISLATALIGGAAFLSLAFIFSKWMRRK